jgi:hypothetical protein
MTERQGADQGREGDRNAGLGQQRVGEEGPGPDQTARSPAAGGPGSGAGDDAETNAETEHSR